MVHLLYQIGVKQLDSSIQLLVCHGHGPNAENIIALKFKILSSHLNTIPKQIFLFIYLLLPKNNNSVYMCIYKTITNQIQFHLLTCAQTLASVKTLPGLQKQPLSGAQCKSSEQIQSPSRAHLSFDTTTLPATPRIWSDHSLENKPSGSYRSFTSRKSRLFSYFLITPLNAMWRFLPQCGKPLYLNSAICSISSMKSSYNLGVAGLWLLRMFIQIN